jgi:hypothetical protein
MQMAFASTDVCGALSIVWWLPSAGLGLLGVGVGDDDGDDDGDDNGGDNGDDDGVLLVMLRLVLIASFLVLLLLITFLLLLLLP